MRGEDIWLQEAEALQELNLGETVLLLHRLHSLFRFGQMNVYADVKL